MYALKLLRPNSRSEVYTQDKNTPKDKPDKHSVYHDKHGNHFSCKLANYASSLLPSRKWDTNSISKYINDEDLSVAIKSDKYSLGDLTFMSNWVYSTLYSRVVYSLSDCILMAIPILCSFKQNTNLLDIWLHTQDNPPDLSKYID